jgi:hypothetical protein
MSWLLFDSLPEGFIWDKTAGSPKTGYGFATNGKSVINGGKRILVRVSSPQNELFFEATKPALETNKELTGFLNPSKKVKKALMDSVSAKTFNELARSRFKLQMLNDILVDLTICEIEGWSKKVYINELKLLINGIKV